MIKRYANEEIERIFSDENKTFLWQEVELAVLESKEHFKMIPQGTSQEIKKIWEENPIDLPWWRSKDEEIHHDLNAFILERVRHLPIELQKYVHDKMTSFDTEETPFLKMLCQANDIITEKYQKLEDVLEEFAKKNRYTIMIARTHGQEAELKSLGARALSWMVELRNTFDDFNGRTDKLHYSKISGAVGNYGGSMSPKVETDALLRLKFFMPFYGATQIIPRSIHASLAQSLCNLVLVLDKIAHDIRLNARSGRPLLQEPFKRTQMGSSAMPQKKNPIQLEQVEGMARLAKGCASVITENIHTWEERAIEQSSVERVAWPDLYQVTVRTLDIMQKVLSKLTIYRENMLKEIIDARGTYASGEAKEFLKKHLADELGYEECYRIVQLACFNVFENVNFIDPEDKSPQSLEEADLFLKEQKQKRAPKVISIEDIISCGGLFVSDQLAITESDVNRYNSLLLNLFRKDGLLEEWSNIFKPSFLLKNEEILFKKILSD